VDEITPADDPQFKDEMDKLQIDQLHKVVLELAKNWFELKKLCITVLVSAATLIAVFTTQKLDAALFVGCGIIVLFFYVADAQSYYYQEKIRIRMRELAIGLTKRHSRQIEVPGMGMPLEQRRINQARVPQCVDVVLHIPHRH
jgi:hypothetical protein